MKEKTIEKIYNDLLKEIKKYHKLETSNFQLEKLGNYLFKTKFNGVYPSDQIPDLQKGQCCILNLDPHYMTGSHWVSLIRDHDGKKLYFYDSFARKIKDTIPILQKKFKNQKIYYDTKDVEQPEHFQDCGQRCICSIIIFYDYGSEAFLKI